MRHKDKYPTFWKYYKKQTGSYLDILVCKRNQGRIPFFRQFFYGLNYRINRDGLYRAIHDIFIGTRVL